MDVLKALRARQPAVEFPKQNKDAPEKHYVLEKELGSGAFSVVYLATHKTTGKKWAVKVVDKKSTSAKQMLSEIKVMSMLEHENVVNFNEIFDTPRAYYVVLEYITGGELFDRIIELQRYTEGEAIKVVKQSLLALDHLHSKGFVHRDLKPENLLLSSKEDDAVVKLADFGFAEQCSGHNLKSILGTPAYMAPEMVALRKNREGGYGQPVDSWAMGLIIYIMLSGIHPFQIEENEDKMLDNIERGDWPWLGSNWAQISEQGKDLVAKLMHPDPNQRLTIKQALSHPWIEGHSDRLDTDITVVRDELKKFQARKRFRGAIFAVAASNRLRLAALALKGSQSRDSIESQSDDAGNELADEVNDQHDQQEDVPAEEQPVHATQSEPIHTETHHAHSTSHSTPSHTAQETHATHTVSAPASTSASYPYDQLKTGANWPSDIDPQNREKYLADGEFKTVFGVTREEFQKMPMWKQSSMKKDKKLF